MKERIVVEDTPEGIFLMYYSSKRRIAQLTDSSHKEQDARILKEHFNKSLHDNVVAEQSRIWLSNFVNKHKNNTGIDSFTRDTAVVLLALLGSNGDETF